MPPILDAPGRHRSATGPRAGPFASVSPRSAVPLAWRNAVADKRRLARSVSGIAFAVLLVLLELGFRNAFLDSALEVMRQFDGDLFLTSSTKFRFGHREPFSWRQLHAARAVIGVASARPIYAAWVGSGWKNPQSHKIYDVQVLAFDPDQPVFLFPEVRAHIDELRQPDTALADRRARSFLGTASAGTVTELARRQIRIVGDISLGPDFTTDGTLIMSDRTFMKLFSSHRLARGEHPDVELGAVKLQPGFTTTEVQHALQLAMPAAISVLTPNELLTRETRFQSIVSPVGPIFTLGAAIGFIVGMTIIYQILHSDLSDQLPQYATLKAMGYPDSYLVRVVLEQAACYGLIGFLPALALATLLYRLIGDIALLPLRMTGGIVLGALALTLAMSTLAALLAVRRLVAADPAQVF
jgi:putative ABC transport system permease protein